jgi:PPOX class probable F420-dependent enzyme
MILEPEVRQALAGTSIAHLATVGADGAPHAVPVFVGTEGDRIAIFTDPGSFKARNLRRDPRVALSIAPADNPFNPITIRGSVVEWIDGEPAWQIIDRIAMKYTGQPYSRELRRAVALIEPEWQAVGVR